jgi:multidrug transporter EmrE-like cation transporter
MTNIFIFIIYFFFTCTGMVLIKLGGQSSHNVFLTLPILDFKLSPVSLLGFFTYGLSFLLYSSLLTKYELTFLNPVTIGITAILIFLCGVMFFNEAVTFAKLSGLFLILCGVLIVNFIK